MIVCIQIKKEMIKVCMICFFMYAESIRAVLVMTKVMLFSKKSYLMFHF